MVKRLTLLFVVLSLAGGVLAGTPLHAPNDGMMECCKRAKSKEQSKAAEIARLCCAVNCSTNAPTSSGTSFNAAPSNFTITRSIAGQIAALFVKERAVSINPTSYSRKVLARTFQPKYLQNNSFLI